MQLPNPGHALNSFKVVETQFQPHLNGTYSMVHVAEGSLIQKRTQLRSTGEVEATNTVAFGDIEPSETNGGKTLNGIRRTDFANEELDLPLLAAAPGHLSRCIKVSDGGPRPGYRAIQLWLVPVYIAFTAIGSDNYVVLAVQPYHGALTGETYTNKYRSLQKAKAG